jgi:hypothetical protein
MKTLIGPLLVLLAAAAGCSRAEYVPDGPLAKPLTQFERIDIRPLADKLPATRPESDLPGVSPQNFMQFFRKDLTLRLLRRNVFALSNGPLLVLQGSLVHYHCESRKPTHAKDNLTNKATIVVEILLTDEAGNRVGGGKSSIEYGGSTQDGALNGAEVRVVRAVAAYLRKAARTQGADEPDDP